MKILHQDYYTFSNSLRKVIKIHLHIKRKHLLQIYTGVPFLNMQAHNVSQGQTVIKRKIRVDSVKVRVYIGSCLF